MPEKAIVFDVDGTLIDSVDLHTRAWQEAFAEFGNQLHFAELRSQIGKGAAIRESSEYHSDQVSVC
jgi:beta-phosphoglucomutase-like phosphatase (HAD superfamily)